MDLEALRHSIERQFVEHKVVDWAEFKLDAIWLVAFDLYNLAMTGDLHLQVIHSKSKAPAIEIIKEKMADFIARLQREYGIDDETITSNIMQCPNFMVEAVEFTDEEISQISRLMVH